MEGSCHPLRTPPSLRQRVAAVMVQRQPQQLRAWARCRRRLPLWMRVPMEIVLQLGSLVGMSAKVLALARKPDGTAQSAAGGDTELLGTRA